MSTIGISQKLLNAYDGLTPSERKVADYIWNHLDAVTHLSSRELAKEAGVSLGTVINFCRAIGMDGFNSLRLAIAREMGKKQLLDTSMGQINPYFRLLIDTMVATSQSLDSDELEKASQILASASSVVLFGGGSSGKICHLAAEMLAHFGRLVTSFDQLSTLRAAAQSVTEGTAVIVVSHRGQEPNVVETLKLCRKRGGRTICITNSNANPLALECEVVLQTSVKTLGSDLDMIIQPVREAQMAVIHLLVLKALGEHLLYPEVAANPREVIPTKKHEGPDV
ncbi:MAG: MurR/RpiR family transcriptional regulator [Firmicutes bacterium]|nr:MurR/RpiR family transcriptional regulator [Bacillota bacterium]